MMDDGSPRPRERLHDRCDHGSLAIWSTRASEPDLSVVSPASCPVQNRRTVPRGLVAVRAPDRGWHTVCHPGRSGRVTKRARPARGLAPCKTPGVKHGVPRRRGPLRNEAGEAANMLRRAISRTPRNGRPASFDNVMMGAHVGDRRARLSQILSHRATRIVTRGTWCPGHQDPWERYGGEGVRQLISSSSREGSFGNGAVGSVWYQ